MTHIQHTEPLNLHCRKVGGHIFACIYLVRSLKADEFIKTIEGYVHTQFLDEWGDFLEPQPKWRECKAKPLDVKDQAYASTICKLN